jgi:hypothetical protein
VPDSESNRALQLVADLHIELSSERGSASAHLYGDGSGLVLDVDNPAALLSQARGQQFPLEAVRQLIPETPVSVRSQGRDLARLRLTPAGKLRIRPTPMGLGTVARMAMVSPRGRLAIGSILVALVAAGIAKDRR